MVHPWCRLLLIAIGSDWVPPTHTRTNMLLWKEERRVNRLGELQELQATSTVRLRLATKQWTGMISRTCGVIHGHLRWWHQGHHMGYTRDRILFIHSACTRWMWHYVCTWSCCVWQHQWCLWISPHVSKIAPIRCFVLNPTPPSTLNKKNGQCTTQEQCSLCSCSLLLNEDLSDVSSGRINCNFQPCKLKIGLLPDQKL